MSSYDERIRAFSMYGMDAIDRLVQDHAALFLSIDKAETIENLVAVTRLRSDLPAPASEEEAYDMLASILGEFLRDSQLKVADYGLSVMGHNQREELIRRASGETPAKPDPYAEVTRLYKTNVSEFNSRRASDADFLKRSNEAQAAGLLR